MRIFLFVMSASKKVFGARKFYDLPDEIVPPFTLVGGRQNGKNNPSKLMKYIDDNVIGKNQTFPGPFGKRKVVYCDYTASGRALHFIEDYIMKEVLPMYGNTHTTTTITSLQSTLYRDEARDIIRNAVRASEDDVVLFTGHGCTGAVHKLIHSLNLSIPPVVFVGPWEHHSNLLPWREIGSKIIRIPENEDGILDLVTLERQLKDHQNLGNENILIGCFSVASNITGNLADDVATTLLLHQYGALSFWDYATAAPYVPIDMNPFIPGISETNANKDAIFFSGHKFVGGVQSPGILVAKKTLFQNPVPEVCGGGTVFFVTREDHRYLKDPELREEGGTGAIVESIRAGMAMQLKQSVGLSAIMNREEEIVKMVLAHIKTIPEVILLGSSSNSVKRLAVFSLMVRHPRGTFLHHNFVCAVLNDMFGIQARGGCACAGPYAQDLLGIDEELAKKYEAVLLEDCRLDRRHLRRKGEYSSYEMLRPGFTRLSLPYFMSDNEIGFVMEALKMVATEGWKLLPQYILNPETGEWRHQSNMAFRERKWLGSIRYNDGKISIHERKTPYTGVCPLDHSECLRVARNYFNRARKIAQKHPLTDHFNLFDEELNLLRWFMLPSEAQDLLLGHYQNVKQDVPFYPAHYSHSRQPSISMQGNRGKNLLSPDSSTLSKPLVQRQRSDSHSSTQRTGNSLFPHILTRERCHSLGSTLLSEMLPNKLETNRQRQISCGSQTDVADSSMTGNLPIGECDGKIDPQTQVYLTTNTPELLQAYVKGVTKELATEIKSELRGVIAQVEDVLSENCYDSDQTDCVAVSEKNLSCHSNINTPSPTCMSVTGESNIFYTCSSPNCQTTISAENALANQLSEYLVGFTSEVVSEMKSELREVVNAVDDMISPSTEIPNNNKVTSTSIGAENSKNKGFKEIMVSSDNKFSFKKELFKSASGNENTSSDSSSSSTAEISLQEQNASDECFEDSTNEFESINKIGSCSCDTSFNHNSEITVDNESSLGIEKTSIPVVKPNWQCPTKNIWKPTSQAISEYEMIRNGDRVLVCLSGGKDSLSLLHTLRQYQHYSASKGIHFELAAATVDPKSSAYDPRPLIPYLEALGIKYFYEEQPILEQASKTECKSVCSFCSRMKRGRLYSTARQNNYNVLALGQHLDDIAESFFMSIFHNGRMRSMKAHYYVREKDLRVIRPFIYVRERSLRKFAETRNLPVIPENCPACFQAPKERNRMKQLLAQQEIMFPKLFLSIKTAIKPLISFRFTDEENNAFRQIYSSIQSSDYSEDEN